jgi:hypothetical protein
MYRSPDTTALVGRLKESVKDLRGERDALSSQLNALKLDVRWVGVKGGGGGGGASLLGDVMYYTVLPYLSSLMLGLCG